MRKKTEISGDPSQEKIPIRPAVANVDQALAIFRREPAEPNFNLLDHFLVMMEYQKVKTVICFNKEDLSTKEELEELQRSTTAVKARCFSSAPARKKAWKQSMRS